MNDVLGIVCKFSIIMVLLLLDSHISNLYTIKRIRNLPLRVTSSLQFHGLIIIKIK